MDPLTPKQWKKYNKAIFALNNLVTPKRVLKYAIIAITQAVTEGPPIGIAT